MIDFHCHLDLYDAPHEIVRECCERRLYVLSVTTTPSAFEGTAALIPSGTRIRTALGLHPELVGARAHELPLFKTLLSRTSYVGEVGLDRSRHNRNNFEQQCAILRDILHCCRDAGGRIITLHSRGATREILDLLGAQPEAGKFVLHWYLGTPRQVSRAAEMGCWFSVGPAMLTSERGLAAVRAMPRDRVIPESDGPFGKIDNRPAYPWDAASVIPKLAVIWQNTEAQVRASLIETFKILVATHPK